MAATNRRQAVDTQLSPELVQYLLAAHGRRLSDAAKLAENWMRTTTRPRAVRLGNQRQVKLPASAYWHAATSTKRARLKKRYADILRSAGELLSAEILRRRGETPSRLARYTRALTALNRSGDGIHEHEAIALFAFVAAAEEATAAGDVERLEAADFFLEHYVSRFRAGAAIRSRASRDRVNHRPKRRTNADATNQKRTTKTGARLLEAQSRYLTFRRDDFSRSAAVVAVHGEFPKPSDRGNFTRWLRVKELEERLESDLSAGLLVDTL